MRSLFVILLSAFACSAFSQSTGDVQLGVKSSSGPLTPVWITKAASKVIGWDASSVLGPITLNAAAVGLGNVENTALSTWAGSGNVTTVGTLSAGAIPTSLLTGTLSVANGGTGQSTFTNGQLLIGNTTGNTLTKATLTAGSGITITNGNGSITIAAAGGSGTVTSVAATVPAFLTVTGSPITSSGTLAISLSGTALPVANGGTGITAFGTGIATFLGTPTSANLAAAITNETGTGSAVFGTSPTFTDSIIVNQSGQSQTGGIRVAADPGNGAVRALFIVPPSNNDRVYIGASGQAAYALNLQFCSGIENFPASVARVGNLGFTLFGAGSFNLDPDFSGGGRVNVSTTTTAGSLQVNNTYTSTTSFEGLRLAWASNVASIKPVAGGGGGTVRTAQYFTTGTVFLSSGSGSPESVVTAPIGSIYTRTDGGANTTLYIKESGTGNTGWIAK